MPTTPRNAIPYPAGTDTPAGHTHLQNLATSVDDHIKDLEGTYIGRPSASLAGRFYKATDKTAGLIYRDDGAAWHALHPVPYLTSWPPVAALAVDGMIVDYAPTSAELWRLRYRAGSSSGYKWEVIHATPKFTNIDTDQTNAGTTYTDLATNGPDVTVPRDGDYYVEIGSNGYHPGGATSTTLYMSYAVGGFPATDAKALLVSLGAPPNEDYAHFSCSRLLRENGIAAGTLLRMKYKTGGGGVTCHWRWRWMRVRPIRIS